MASPNVILSPSSRKTDSLAHIDRVEVLGVGINVLSRHGLSAHLRECLEHGYTGWISYVNVHALNLAHQHPWFRLFLNSSLMSYCDGQGVRLGASILGHSLPERIVMTDWIYDVCELAVARGIRISFVGSTEIVITKAVESLKAMYPDLQIVGFHHGYLSDLDSEVVVHSINQQNPDVLIVGMGMPHQEEWILKYGDRLKAQIILNAGSCFDYVAGEKKRCPAWIGALGFEWLYRLVHEPRRLWKRYLIGNPIFLFRVLSSRLKTKAASG